ncbi:hypothetical protein HHK36_007811 [Tetracentron sinense]|uniref:WAT1-related protein n=1 Tax=Tetracentron sinense TaxID=13715 RepID=A0A834ZEF7_TETSI|nr:hypothetical protein HHK36_007811 [Tetracentron sinense]
MGDQRLSGLLCVVLITKVKPYLAMVFLQFGYAGMYIITMLSLKQGMSHYILVVYRHIAATLAIAPLALVFERKVRPKMTVSTFLKIMVLGHVYDLGDGSMEEDRPAQTATILQGVLMFMLFVTRPVIDQNLYYVGMMYTSTTFASAMFNVLPVITFIMAILFRLERVKIKEVHSQAKVIGTLVTLAGAMVMTLYKGHIINLIWSRGRSNYESSSGSADQHRVAGTLMLLASCCGWSIVHAKVVIRGGALSDHLDMLDVHGASVVWGKSNDHVVSLSPTSEEVGVLELPIAATDGSETSIDHVISLLPTSEEVGVLELPIATTDSTDRIVDNNSDVCVVISEILTRIPTSQ